MGPVLVLDPIEITLRAVPRICRVCLIGVDVHRKREIRISADPHIAKDHLAVAGNAHAHAH
jgi:hypothetical protein